MGEVLQIQPPIAIENRRTMDKIPDDIFALYSYFDLDGENYRVFEKRNPEPAESSSGAAEKGVAAPAAPFSETPARASATLQVEHRGPAALETVAAYPAFTERQPVQTAYPAVATSGIATSNATRAALHNLWQHVLSSHSASQADAGQLAAQSITIYGAAGGTGSTTVAAMLARCLAKVGRRCAIVEEGEDSILPVFFSSRRLSTDGRRFAGFYSLFQPTIRILNRGMFEQAHTEVPQGSNFIERNIVNFGGQFDHLIFDQPARSLDRPGAALAVYVAIPDLSSLVGARKLKQRLETSGDASKIVCALNRFDSASDLHAEVLSWYQQNFSRVVTIHNSPLVPEALAEGTTVIDWSPRSSVSSDFFNLYKEVSQLLSPMPEFERFDSAVFGSERLPYAVER